MKEPILGPRNESAQVTGNDVLTIIFPDGTKREASVSAIKSETTVRKPVYYGELAFLFLYLGTVTVKMGNKTAVFNEVEFQGILE